MGVRGTQSHILLLQPPLFLTAELRCFFKLVWCIHHVFVHHISATQIAGKKLRIHRAPLSKHAFLQGRLCNASFFIVASYIFTSRASHFGLCCHFPVLQPIIFPQQTSLAKLDRADMSPQYGGDRIRNRTRALAEMWCTQIRMHSHKSPGQGPPGIGKKF